MTFDVVDYTRQLVRIDTTNPPGREAECGELVAATLEAAGFTVHRQHFGDARANIVATLEGADGDLAPLVFTGHLDTVPIGHAAWSHPPFEGHVVDGRLYGRGASDMKGGVAAFIGAALRLASRNGSRARRGLTLVLTSGEETGCAGALHLVSEKAGLLGRASAMLVGEPTANRVATAHKGALFMMAKTRGITAHSAQPELGVNAIYKAARAISRIEDYGFNERPHPLLGSPTINVGMMSGGMNVNSVPDHAQFTIDIRTNATKAHDAFRDDLRQYLGDNVSLETFTDMPAVSTPVDDPFARLAMEVCVARTGEKTAADPIGLPFFTDASAFSAHYQCPTLILGPGEPPAMHQTDEYCLVRRLEEAVDIYSEIAIRWCLDI